MMRIRPGNTVGIDFGTIQSTMAHLNDDGQLVLLQNAKQEKFTPSVVLLGSNGHVVVAPTIEQVSLEPHENLVETIKRQLGNKDWFRLYLGKRLTPEYMTALILHEVRQNAEKQIGRIANAVIAVPNHFQDTQLKAMSDSGIISGLNVIGVIHDSMAAVLAYFWVRGEFGLTIRPSSERTILVYNLGGGMFDVTALRYSSAGFQVLATEGDAMLGGVDWTRRIVDHVSEEFASKFDGADPRSHPNALLMVTCECENAKRTLSSQVQVAINVSFEGHSLTTLLTRDDFERITADLILRTRNATERVHAQTEIHARKLDDVVVAGGATKMPQVETMLQEVCSRQPFRNLNPVEAVVRGAAIHAAVLAQ